MSQFIPWRLFRPDATPRTCPACGHQPEAPVVIIRHEHARCAGHAPAWTICEVCRRQYALGVATGDDCRELVP